MPALSRMKFSDLNHHELIVVVKFTIETFQFNPRIIMDALIKNTITIKSESTKDLEDFKIRVSGLRAEEGLFDFRKIIPIEFSLNWEPGYDETENVLEFICQAYEIWGTPTNALFPETIETKKSLKFEFINVCTPPYLIAVKLQKWLNSLGFNENGGLKVRWILEYADGRICDMFKEIEELNLEKLGLYNYENIGMKSSDFDELSDFLHSVTINQFESIVIEEESLVSFLAE